MKKKNSQPSSQSRSGRSVRFNLDQNSICDKGGAEYSLEADVYWYTNDKVRSMGMRTARKIDMYRQWIAVLRRLQERTDQRRFLSTVIGEDEDEACIHGIENLVSKVSLRRKIVSMNRDIWLCVTFNLFCVVKLTISLSALSLVYIYLDSAEKASDSSSNRGASSPET